MKKGQKKSRLSASLAEALSSGAQLPPAKVEDEQEEDTTTTVQTEKTGGEGGDGGNAGGDKTNVAVELNNEGGNNDDPPNPTNENAEQATADLAAANARITELTSQVGSLTTQLATQKGVTDHIQTQLTTANTSLAKAQVELENANKRSEEQGVNIGLLRTQLVHATTRLGIALSTQIAGLEEMSDANLVAQYSKLNTDFENKFHVGPQHAADTDVQNNRESNPAVVQTVASAATRATTLPTKKR